MLVRIGSQSSRLADAWITFVLPALSPLSVLARGYSVTFDTQGRALTRASQVQPGEHVRVRLHEGALSTQVLPPEKE